MSSLVLPKGEERKEKVNLVQTVYEPTSNFRSVQFTQKKEDPLLPLAPLVTSKYERIEPSFEKKPVVFNSNPINISVPSTLPAKPFSSVPPVSNIPQNVLYKPPIISVL